MGRRESILRSPSVGHDQNHRIIANQNQHVVELNEADHYRYPTWERATLQSIQSLVVLVIGS